MIKFKYIFDFYLKIYVNWCWNNAKVTLILYSFDVDDWNQTD